MRFAPCPACHRDKGGRDTSNTCHEDSGLWFCWSCRKAGNFFTLTRAFGSPLPEDDRYLVPPELQRDKIDAGWRALLARSTVKPRRPVTEGHYPALLDYCHRRGLTDGTLNDWRVSTMGDRTLRWPLCALSEDGSEWLIANARLRVCLDRDRSKTKDWFEHRGGETGLMLGNHLLDLDAADRRIMITEGQWDAMTAYELGIRNVFSLPNGAAHVDVAKMLRYIPDDWFVVLAADMDPSGDRCAEALFAALGPDRMARLYLPAKDLNEWYVQSGFTLTPEKIYATMKSTVGRAVVGVVENHWLDVMEDTAVEAKPLPICDMPWDRLTSLLNGGPKAGQSTGILAPSGAGKTTFVTQIGIHAAARGVRTGMIQIEGDRISVRERLRDAIAGYVGDGYDIRDVSKNLLVSKLHGVTVRWEDTIAEMEQMAKAGCQVIIMDNFDAIMTRANLLQAIQQKVQAFGRVVELILRYGVHIFTVWQPVKIEKNVVVNSGHMKGAGQIFQDSDNYVNLNHVDGLVRIEIEKCRDIGGKGGLLWLKYDEKRRCYGEVERSDEVADPLNAGRPKGFKDFQET